LRAFTSAAAWATSCSENWSPLFRATAASERSSNLEKSISPSSGEVAIPSPVAEAYCLSSTERTSEATLPMSRVRGLATTPPTSFR
jgi:hypothetical protein